MSLSANLAPVLNSVGLLCDIVGAWLVANEVVREFRGRRYKRSEGWTSGSYAHGGEVKETGESLAHEMKTYSLMKWGLAFLTLGFTLQIASNWIR